MNNTDRKIFKEQVHLLFANSVVPILVSLLVGVLLCWSLRTVIPQHILVSWLALFFSISLVRIVLLILYKKHNTESRNEGKWYWRFLVSTYAIATLWGSASFLLFPEQSLSHQLVFFIILSGMAAGGIASLCPSLPVVVGFLTLILLPLTAKMMTFGTDDALFKGLLVLLFWSVTMVGAVKVSITLRENIQLHLQSIDREKILKLSEERYRHIFRNTPLGIFHYDSESAIVDCNDEFIKIIGSSKELLVGLKMIGMVQDKKMVNAIKDSLSTGEGYYEGDYTSINGNKTTPVRVFLKAINSLDQSIVGGVGIVEDFTDKKQTELEIQYHASYDSLTKLPNRRLLLEHLNSEMSRARRHGHYGALLFIDLDNFKTINDSLGHSVGDELLKVVAKRIKECIRHEDIAARMGGDEFIIIVTELDTSMELAAHKVRGIAEEISLCLSAPCQI
ncbi:MAG: sensor domain-containing diguanylate cyclase, partial [Desulforhopalus sp.]